MRTGAFGQRTVDELIATLPEPKRTIFQELRAELKKMSLNESIDYDAYELEWNPIYTTKDGKEVLRMNFKWDFSATLNVPRDKEKLVFDSQGRIDELFRDAEDDGQNKRVRYPIGDKNSIVVIIDIVRRLLSP